MKALFPAYAHQKIIRTINIPTLFIGTRRVIDAQTQLVFLASPFIIGHVDTAAPGAFG